MRLPKIFVDNLDLFYIIDYLQIVLRSFLLNKKKEVKFCDDDYRITYSEEKSDQSYSVYDYGTVKIYFQGEYVTRITFKRICGGNLQYQGLNIYSKNKPYEIKLMLRSLLEESVIKYVKKDKK